MTNPHGPDVDARIDEMARAAGGALRHPAPADGVTRARRSSRTKQTTRLALAGTAVLTLGVVGVVAVGGNDAKHVGPADTVASTLPTATSADSSVVPTEPPTTTVPPSTEPSTTASGPSAAGAPEVVYATAGSAMDITGEQMLIDPNDGSVTGTAGLDPEQSRSVQDELYGQGAMQGEPVNDQTRPGELVSRFVIGTITYETESLPSEIIGLESQDPNALPRFDRCGQSPLVVTGAAHSALPERVATISVTADGRYLVVLSAECPEAGTLADGFTTSDYVLTLQVFDAAHPEQPGRQLASERAETCQCSLNGFSHNGRFLALRSFTNGLRFRVFDLEMGHEIEVADGCEQHFTTFADIFGPWVGASSLAILADCGSGLQLLIRDVMPGGGEVRVPLPGSVISSAEVDVAHFDRPETAWFTLCSFDAHTCWIGQGNRPLVEIPNVNEASFVPLGFRYGG